MLSSLLWGPEQASEWCFICTVVMVSDSHSFAESFRGYGNIQETASCSRLGTLGQVP